MHAWTCSLEALLNQQLELRRKLDEFARPSFDHRFFLQHPTGLSKR